MGGGGERSWTRGCAWMEASSYRKPWRNRPERREGDACEGDEGGEAKDSERETLVSWATRQ